MASDDMATQESRASIAMILTKFNISKHFAHETDLFMAKSIMTTYIYQIQQDNHKF